MLHVYALLRRPATVPATAGIDDAPLRVVTVESEIEAVVSDTNGPGAPGEAAILAHARVVEALAGANDAVLPARFADRIADEDDLRQRLHGRRRELTGAFRRVSGCVEMGVRAFRATKASQPRPDSGRAYMQRRLDDVGSAEQLARQLDEALAALVREGTSRVLASGESLLAAAYLVPRAELEQFRAAIGAVERARPDLTLVTTGPWPPYSFALLDADAA